MSELRPTDRPFNPELAMTPGAPRAIEKGCLCPQIDNYHGKGIPVNGKFEYWINGLCPLHGLAPASGSHA